MRLNEIILIVQELVRTTNKKGATRMHMAMHEENVMFRRTPYGTQLVITDPIGGDKVL